MKEIIEQLCQHVDLSEQECAGVFSDIVQGKISEIELSAFLTALKAKGESPPEIAAAANALRNESTIFDSPDYLFADCCGTGGDGLGTVNISTAVAFIAAQAGLPIAKHGNVSVSSSCGSANVLSELGVKLDPTPELARRCLDELGICFLFAPSYHPGMRHAMPVRKALGFRTIFNLLGPLINPAKPPCQIIGVYSPSLIKPIGLTLKTLGLSTALVVHGSGLDEIAIHGETQAMLLKNGKLQSLTITPQMAGLKTFELSELRGGDPKQNSIWLDQMLRGKASDAQNAAVAINTGALLWISGLAPTLIDGTSLALETILSQETIVKLERLVELSNA